MGGSDRTVLIVVPLVALALGFWLLVIGPKRSDSADLQTQIDGLNASISAAEAQVASAEAARDQFPKTYAKLVTLGRAVPEDGDQATFINDMANIGKSNNVQFRDFALTAGVDPASAPEPAPAPPAADPAGGDTPAEPAADAAAPAPALATEATAASLPLGATVGSAGLPVVPYDFRFLGSFFHMADFFHDVDQSVVVSDKSGEPKVKGRLVTIDSFELSADPVTGFPDVQADFAVTTYVVPSDQGLSAGATPAGPAPISSPAAPTPVSTGVVTP